MGKTSESLQVVEVSISECGTKGPMIESALQTSSLFFTKTTAIRSFGHGLHSYCSA